MKAAFQCIDLKKLFKEISVQVQYSPQETLLTNVLPISLIKSHAKRMMKLT